MPQQDNRSLGKKAFVEIRTGMLAAITFYCWLALSLLYYAFVHTPAPINIVVNLSAGLVCTLALAAVSSDQLLLKVYLISFSLATALASLQLSRDQPAFTPDFILFLVLHMSLLGLAIAAGTAVVTRPFHVHRNDSNAILSVLLLALIAIAVSVTLMKGVRLTGFLQGLKTDGDLYRVSGLSGLQGVLTIFLLCCFTSMGKLSRVVLVLATLAISIVDVKRGDSIRILTFLFFCALIFVHRYGLRRRYLILLVGLGIITAIVFVIAGEVRQNLYSAGVSISSILNSRINISSVDWLYGYFGINISVLQRYFESATTAPGYFAQLLQLTFSSSPGSLAETMSINGFNAGTAFSTFASANQIFPTADYFVFCVLIAAMVALAKASGSISLMAFLMLQIFGFVFGNQLILPYYLIGYFAAGAYLISANATAEPLTTVAGRHGLASMPPGQIHGMQAGQRPNRI
ncbi:hypothetical protein [Devosia sp. Root635]|uniref:hypothetical protein n=1 Tax=Devosia sp. Root635 TaxID=1736575 RepID=UPI0012E36086|nr:hypothetical protein [Devosia sp. Root635]